MPPSAPPALQLRSHFERALARVERQRPPVDLVENRVTYGAEDAEFAVYDTFLPARRVPLRASNPLLCGMVRGKKQIHTARGDAIALRPSESLLVPSDQTIHIDFPGASLRRPTKCLTIEIDRCKVERVAAGLNERAPRPPESGEWAYDDGEVCHFRNTPGVDRTLRQLAALFIEDHPDKALLIDLGVQELIVRMLRMEARRALLDDSASKRGRDPLAAAVDYAKRHLHESLTVAKLAHVAGMSESTFYRYFRTVFGQTPLAFVTAARVARARQLLAEPRRSVLDVAAAVGFASPSHFIRVFARHTGHTPKQYQLRLRRAGESG